MLLWSRKIQPIIASLLAGTSVVLFRISLDYFASNPFYFLNSFLESAPAFIYYFTFAVLFHFLVKTKDPKDQFVVGIICVLIDIIANLSEIFVRHVVSGMTFSWLDGLLIIGIAIVRVFFVLSFYNILILKESMLAEEQQRKRNQEILFHVSNLYIEMIQVKKSAKDAENMTNLCFQLHRKLKENESDLELAEFALDITSQLHEIKKDNQRIYAGLSKLIIEKELNDKMTIAEIIDMILLMNKHYAQSIGKNVEFKQNINGVHPHYFTFKIISILNNLVANAIEAIPKSGEILLSATIIKQTLVIFVSDSGTGISERNQKQLFKPGFTTKFDQQGNPSNGIGLFHVKNAIENLGGNIALVNAPPYQTSFKIAIPLENLEE